jgi:hypothetical protein
MLSEAEIVAQKVIEAFDALGIGYFIGGSVASTIHGIPRMTMDVDIVSDMSENQVESFVARLEEEFYVDADMIRTALANQSSFNVIHLLTMVKADIFAMKRSPWADMEWTRRQRKRIGPEDDSPEAFVASAEDMVLQKLQWYRMTGERSDRQWGDVQGILKVQAERLDVSYLRRWAGELLLTDLLTQSLLDAGLEDAA